MSKTYSVGHSFDTSRMPALSLRQEWKQGDIGDQVNSIRSLGLGSEVVRGQLDESSSLTPSQSNDRHSPLTQKWLLNCELNWCKLPQDVPSGSRHPCVMYPPPRL